MTTPNRPPLSPAAQAVMDAAWKELDYAPRRHVCWVTGAALRAAVDQTASRQYEDCWICAANDILAIANELEAQP